MHNKPKACPLLLNYTTNASYFYKAKVPHQDRPNIMMTDNKLQLTERGYEICRLLKRHGAYNPSLKKFVMKPQVLELIKEAHALAKIPPEIETEEIQSKPKHEDDSRKLEDPFGRV